jgi:hypothetical protein
MLYYGAAEPSGVVSLDTYHRLEEIDRAWDESAEAKWRHSSVTIMIDEFLDYAARDPVIGRFYASEWKAIQPRIKSFSDRPVESVEAVRYLKSILRPSYLRNCREYIRNFVVSEQLKNRRELRITAENLCSYLLNSGHQPHAVFWYIHLQIYSRNFNNSPERKVNDFFQNFSCRPEKYNVVVSINDRFSNILKSRLEFQSLGTTLPKKFQANKFVPKFTNLFLYELEALDAVDARARGELLGP